MAPRSRSRSRPHRLHEVGRKETLRSQAKQRSRVSCPECTSSREDLAGAGKQAGRVVHNEVQQCILVHTDVLQVAIRVVGVAFYSEVYAQWGNVAQALDSLETAERLQDGGLAFLKTDPLLDPLRKEPRFQAIERELKFPD